MGSSFLVTGGAGFIGSHLTDQLLAQGNQVTVLDSLATGRLSNLENASAQPGFRYVAGSVLDPLAVDELVKQSDVVVHLAAAVGVKLVVDHPLRSFTTNIRGSENVLDAAHRYRRPILLASTSEIYGKNPAQPLAESADRVLGSPTVARWAYSTSKAVDEILAWAYYKERGLPTVVVRLFNTVGPRQTGHYGMVIPRLVGQALAGNDLTVYGDGSQTRCFCHVQDVVGALIGLLGEPSAVGEVFNVGSAEEVSILSLAERIIEKTSSSSSIRLVPYDQAYESGFEDMARRVPDTSKLRSLTGWTPTRVLDQILDDVIAQESLTLAVAQAVESGLPAS